MVLTKKKILLWVGILLLALLIGAVCIGYFVLQFPLFDRSGWNTTDTGSVQYLDYYGKPLTTGRPLMESSIILEATVCSILVGWIPIMGVVTC